MRVVLIILILTPMLSDARELASETTSLDSLNLLSKSYACKNVTLSDSISDYVIKNSRESNNYSIYGNALLNKGRNRTCLSEFAIAIEFNKKALWAFNQSKDQRGIAIALNNLATNYSRVSRLDTASVLFRKMISVSTNANDTLLTLAAFSGLSGVFQQQVLIDSSIYYSQKVLRLAESAGIYSYINIANLTIGGAYYSNEDYKAGLKYFLDAEKGLLKTNEVHRLGTLYYNLGTCYAMVDSLEKSFIYHNKALNDPYWNQDQFNLAYSYQGLAHAYQLSGDYLKAIELNQKSIEISENIGEERSLTTAYMNLSGCYFELKNYNLAIKHANNAIKHGESIGYHERISDSYWMLYKAYEATGKFEQALKAHKDFYSAEEKFLNESKNETIAKLEQKYESEKKEKEIVFLSQQNQIHELQLTQQKFLLGTAGILIILLAVGGTFYYKQKRLKQRQALTDLELKEAHRRLEIEQQYRTAELKALRSQMNPHFVFNALNSIQEYIMLNEKKLAGKYLGKFADLMRIYLHHSGTKSVTIHEEVEALKLYLELEKLRFEDALQYTINIESDVDIDLINMPTLLVQPYVENALKHGLLHKEGERALEITFRYKEQESLIECEIYDNGIGRKKSMEINKHRNPGHKSFATDATKNRLELLNFNRDDKIGEEIHDLKNDQGQPIGTRVALTIPSMEFVA